MKPAATQPIGGDSSRWRAHAACADTDAELFFPPSERASYRKQIDAARLVCTGCEVRLHCLTEALDNWENHGIWGGYTPRELTRIARRRLAASKGRATRVRRTSSPTTRYVQTPETTDEVA